MPSHVSRRIPPPKNKDPFSKLPGIIQIPCIPMLQLASYHKRKGHVLSCTKATRKPSVDQRPEQISRRMEVLSTRLSFRSRLLPEGGWVLGCIAKADVRHAGRLARMSVKISRYCRGGKCADWCPDGYDRIQKWSLRASDHFFHNKCSILSFDLDCS